MKIKPTTIIVVVAIAALTFVSCGKRSTNSAPSILTGSKSIVICKGQIETECVTLQSDGSYVLRFAGSKRIVRLPESCIETTKIRGTRSYAVVSIKKGCYEL